MDYFKGKKGVILGVANDHSIAYYVSKALHSEGAELAYNHLPDSTGKMERRVRKAIDTLSPKLLKPCDMASDDDLNTFFGEVKSTFGTIDFLVHSVAFAPLEEIRRPTLEVSRKGFAQAMDISAYSLIGSARLAAEIMNPGGSILAMTYYGGEKVVAGYNLMGVCKAALESVIKYTAFDLGPKNIRVNGISAGPVRTLAASGVGDLQTMLAMYSAISPMGRNIDPEEVGKSALYFLSDMASATTGEIHHVDCGYNIMGNPGRATEVFKKKL